jgi:hypothetical protein
VPGHVVGDFQSSRHDTIAFCAATESSSTYAPPSIIFSKLWTSWRQRPTRRARDNDYLYDTSEGLEVVSSTASMWGAMHSQVLPFVTTLVVALVGAPAVACAQTDANCKFGISGPDAKPLPALIEVTKSLLQSTETIVGTWLDPCGPCSLIVITSRPGRGLDHFDVCADGSTSRSALVAGGDLRWSPLVAIKVPSGAKRAWQTPGLVCRPKTILGERTQQCTDKSGGVNDRDTFIELPDGTLRQFQDGVGLDGRKAVVTARPIEMK